MSVKIIFTLASFDSHHVHVCVLNESDFDI